MTKKENALTTYKYIAHFTDNFIISDDLNLLINTMSVYGIVDNCVRSDTKVDFTIEVIGDKKVIFPQDIEYDSYALFCERLVEANVIETKSSDYIHVKEQWWL